MRRCGLLCTIIISMLLSGCGAQRGIYANFRPIEQLRPVETLGYDAGPELTAAVGKTEDTPALTLTARGRSIPDAVDALQARTDRGALFFAHARFVLLGQRAATQGLGALLDYMERDIHMRLDTELFLLDCEAQRAMTAGEADFDLTAAVEAAKRESEAQACGLVLDFRETALALSECGAAPVMLLRCRFPEDGPPELLPDGCGVLRRGVLAGTLERPLAEILGMCLGRAGTLTRTLGSAALLCRGSGTVELERAEARAPAFRLRLEVSAAVDEARDPIVPEELEAALKARLEADAALLVARLGEMDADLLGLRQTLRLGGVAEPEPGWLGRADFAIEAEVTLDRSFDLAQPLELDGGGRDA